MTVPFWLPSIARFAAPGPLMVRASVTVRPPPVRSMSPVTSELKTIVSAPAAALASFTAWRRLPAPASAWFVTWKVAASAEGANSTVAPAAARPPAVIARRRRGASVRSGTFGMLASQ